MQLNEIKPIHKVKKSKIIGRGGKRGSHCGRGIKGQGARESKNYQPMIGGLIKRYPKLRGYKFKSEKELVLVSLDVVDKKFSAEEKVTPQSLLEKRLIRRIKGRTPRVKILGGGEIKKTLNFENCQVSKSAREKIEKAGGSVSR